MLKSTFTKRVGGVKKSVLLATTTALVGSTFAVVGAPAAMADGGKENPNTGIVWGVGQDGTYKVPLQSGREIDGFCIDPTLAYPKQGGITRYGEPKPWGQNMSKADKKAMALSLYLGKLSQDNSKLIQQAINSLKGADKFLDNVERQAKNLGIPIDISVMKRDVKTLSEMTPDQLIAGASGVVHKIGGNPRYGGNGKWSGYRSDGAGKIVYDTILRFAPMIPDFLFDLADVEFKVRSPLDGSNKQRMITMNDIKLPNIRIPGFPTFPVTPPPPPGDDTPPGTPPETTSTTPETETTTTPSSETPPTTPPTRVTRETETPENPEIRTSAGTKEQNVVEVGKSITDTVTYKGLEKGKTYTMVGETYDKATGDSTGNRGEITFTAEQVNGEVDVEIPVQNADSPEQVVFETLYEGEGTDGDVVAEHKDINDASQTVGTPRSTPQIRTSASSSTGNVIQTGTTVDDTVTYSGLVPGKTYRLEARLMCKETGQDTGANAIHEFVPETSEGQTVVQGIQVTDPDCSMQVAFEKLYEMDGDTPYLVASHEDINDAAQTVGAPKSEVQKKKKKIAPEEPEKVAPVQAPGAPKAKAQSNPVVNNAPGAPGGVGGGGGAPAPAPRQVINSVPSGGTDIEGNSIFAK